MDQEDAFSLNDIPEAVGLGIETFASLVVATALLLMVVVRIWRRRGRSETRELIGEDLVDLDFLDQLASAAPPERVQDLFDAMADDCRRCIQDIRRAAKKSDFDGMNVECHALAESCDAFGALGLAKHARHLGEVALDREFKEMARLLVDIDGTADKTFHQITRSLKSVARRRAAG